MADNLDILRGGKPAEVGGGQSFTRKVNDNARVGRSGVRVSRQALYGYDREQGRAKAFGIGADMADRMAPERVAEVLVRLREAFGISRATEGYLYAFDRALMICHALNGSSQLAPTDRVAFYVVDSSDGDARVDDYSYYTVQQVLGVDMRRFFRGLADDVIDACHHLYDHYDVNNSREVELRAQMVALADKRGIQRFPWLIADSADAALNLLAHELAAVIESKKAVVGRTPNAVDTRNLAVPIRSSDNYDSSNSRHVDTSNDIHASSSQYYK